MYHHMYDVHSHNIHVFKTILGVDQTMYHYYRIWRGIEMWFQSWIEPHLWYMDVKTDVKDIDVKYQNGVCPVRHVFPHLPIDCWCREMSNCIQHYCHLDFPENYQHRHPDQSIVNIHVKRYTYHHDDQPDHVKITHLLGIDRNDAIIGHIYLLSPITIQNPAEIHCILVMIPVDQSHVARYGRYLYPSHMGFVNAALHMIEVSMSRSCYTSYESMRHN